MSLRPRYSLLTLLIVTALIAGGVKLWYGPHQIIEERAPGKQLEYTYTRAWNGEKIVQGPSIIRMVEPNGRSVCIVVSYVMKDQQMSCYYLLIKQSINKPEQRGMLLDKDFEVLDQFPISADEQQAFRRAIERERKRIDQDPGEGLAWHELINNNRKEPGDKFYTFRDWESNYVNIINIPWDLLIDAM